MSSATSPLRFCLILFIVVVASPCLSAIWYVNGNQASAGDGTSWETAFKTIQQGVDAAATEDTVIVAPGVYVEDVDIRAKGITIQSVDPYNAEIVAQTVIRSANDTGSTVRTSAIEEVRIEGLTVTGATYSGLSVWSPVAVRRCVITENAASDGAGICCWGGKSLKVEECLIYGNAASGGGGGIRGGSDSPSVIRNSVICGNSAQRGSAISGGQSLEVVNCTIAYNSGGSAVYGPLKITNSILWGNTEDIEGATASYCCIENGSPEPSNFCQQPYFVDAERLNFHLQPWSPCIDAGDPNSDFSREPQPNGGRVNIGAYGNTEEAAPTPEDLDLDGLPDDWERLHFGHCEEDAWGDADLDLIANVHEYLYGWDPTTPAGRHVLNVSSGHYFEQIIPAIMEAADGDEILVFPGVHTGRFSFFGRAIRVSSSDPADPDVVASTIITASEGPVVRFENGEGPTSVLEGMSIKSDSECAIRGKGASPIIRRNVVVCVTGTAIWLSEGNAEIRENTITGSFRPILAAASRSDSHNCAALIVGNTIVDNDSGITCSGGFPVIVGNYVARNCLNQSAYSTRTAIVSSDTCGGTGQGLATIVGNTVVDNGGTGIESSQPALIERNLVLRNQGYGGRGGVYCHSQRSPTWVVGNLIAENVGPHGLYAYQSIVVNNTIANNASATKLESVGINADSETVVWNCIIWGHDVNVSGKPTVRFSCFPEAPEEGDNILDDPMFVNSAVGDYHLLPTSPCIAAGCPRGDMPDIDMDGEPIPLTARPDIGADQFTDTDGDQMPDYWEIAQLGGIEAEAQADADGDGLTNLDELLNRAKPTDTDGDGDGLTDFDEVHLYSTHPCKKDTDDDGVEDPDEIFMFGSNPNSSDTDADGLPDGWEVEWQFSPTIALGDDGPEGDPDGDGLANLDELKWHTDPRDSDTDDDGLPDGWERKYWLSPTYGEGIHGSDGDPDNDGLSNLDEFGFGTDPRSYDTDSDGLPDPYEVAWGLDPTNGTGPDGGDGDKDEDGLCNLEERSWECDPLNPDTDDDGLTDGEEVHVYATLPTNPDCDADGLNDYLEVRELGTDPMSPDTDGDGLPDPWELEWGLDPRLLTGVNGRGGDPDGDHLTNGGEYQAGTDPHKADTDGDGATDGEEVSIGMDPLDRESFFRQVGFEWSEGGQFISITCSSVPGRYYQIWRSQDMRSWQRLGLPKIADGYLIEFVIIEGAPFTQEFFRIQAVP